MIYEYKHIWRIPTYIVANEPIRAVYQGNVAAFSLIDLFKHPVRFVLQLRQYVRFTLER